MPNKIASLSSMSIREALLASLIIAITLAAMSFSEKLNYKFKQDYEEEFGFGSWEKVFRGSLLMGAMSGVLGAMGGFSGSQGFFFYYFAVFGTVIGYISAQSIYTDFPMNRVDRYMLRIGYGITFILTFTMLLTSYDEWELFKVFAIPIAITYLVLFVLFFVSSIGASDMRAIIVFLPFIFAVHMSVGILSFLIVGLITTIFMSYKIRVRGDRQYAIPILPYLTVPYIFLGPMMPIAIDIFRLYKSGMGSWEAILRLF